MKKTFLIACLVLLGLGLWLDNSLLVSPTRRIASALNAGTNDGTEQSDLSQLEGSEFLKAFKYALISVGYGLDDGQQFGFRFGNFLLHNDRGAKVFACEEYNTVDLVFQAEGIAVSGEIPTLTVRGACQTANEPRFIEALMVPYREILASSVSQKDFIGGDSAHPVAVQFQNVVEQWPTSWNLVGVRLSNPEKQTALSLDGYEIISILGQPLTMEWEN